MVTKKDIIYFVEYGSGPVSEFAHRRHNDDGQISELWKLLKIYTKTESFERLKDSEVERMLSVKLKDAHSKVISEDSNSRKSENNIKNMISKHINWNDIKFRDKSMRSYTLNPCNISIRALYYFFYNSKKENAVKFYFEYPSRKLENSFVEISGSIDIAKDIGENKHVILNDKLNNDSRLQNNSIIFRAKKTKTSSKKQITIPNEFLHVSEDRIRISLFSDTYTHDFSNRIYGIFEKICSKNQNFEIGKSCRFVLEKGHLDISDNSFPDKIFTEDSPGALFIHFIRYENNLSLDSTNADFIHSRIENSNNRQNDLEEIEEEIDMLQKRIKSSKDDREITVMVRVLEKLVSLKKLLEENNV